MPQYSWYRPEDFLQDVYNSVGNTYFDAVARHPYTSPYEGSQLLRSRVKELQNLMMADGDVDKPIWITESGYPACQVATVTVAMQAQWLNTNFTTLLNLDNLSLVFGTTSARKAQT